VLHGRRIVGRASPAYNAEATLERTLGDIPAGVADALVLVDDASKDGTVALAAVWACTPWCTTATAATAGTRRAATARRWCWARTSSVMLHPDYQYSPRLLPALADMVASGEYDLALGSRILGRAARKGGMPRYKYVANRGLTLVQNLMVGQEAVRVPHRLPRLLPGRAGDAALERNSDDFVFDNQMLCQAIWAGFRIGEISIPTRYFEGEPRPSASGAPSPTASACSGTSGTLLACRLGLARSPVFPPDCGSAGPRSRGEAG
jgi:glycosyltransferase involved in cell wall biosynthesis